MFIFPSSLAERAARLAGEEGRHRERVHRRPPREGQDSVVWSEQTPN